MLCGAQLHIFIILLEKNSYTYNFFFCVEHIKEFSPDGWWPYWPKLLSEAILAKVAFPRNQHATKEKADCNETGPTIRCSSEMDIFLYVVHIFVITV
ncbi:unnamed protein product [Musa acuminata subsp. malaccensis]|uniref:(wild Malaysian banana) hypothetical protein n=1 Tax=Musa acuminata subsp. malaccensis TaxID=214687 RepID=A0A804HX26_MUSAM|nr:unnamed protein product [Musa acuminata subsp. malaccensis]